MTLFINNSTYIKMTYFLKYRFIDFRKEEGDQNIHDERESPIGCLLPGPPSGMEPTTPLSIASRA